MPPFDSHSREDLRRTYVEAWRKHASHVPLTPLEAMIADVIAAHPEYQALLGDTRAALEFESGGAAALENPFLHMGLHLAVRDQLSIDRPPGVRELHRRLQSRHGDPHQAEHALMEALGEALWQAQHEGRRLDAKR
jgi:hypothetical protein